MSGEHVIDTRQDSGRLPTVVEGLRRFIDVKRIEAAIPRSIRSPGLEFRGYERIGGLTNRNYKVYLGTETLVLRLPGRGTGRFINRSVERANQEAAARAGFTPPPLYFDGRTGVKISRYLHEARALDGSLAREAGSRKEAAALLSHFHRSGIRFVNDFDVFRTAKIYERVARSRFARFFEDFGKIRIRVFGLKERLAAGAPRAVACHNDLVPENFLLTDEGLTLIDWEYSGMNDPYWDLSSFLLESGCDSAQEKDFLACYLGRPVIPRDLARIEAYKLLQDFLWSLWSLLQETANRDPRKARSYREYGRYRFERSLSRLEAVEAGFGSTIKHSRHPFKIADKRSEGDR